MFKCWYFLQVKVIVNLKGRENEFRNNAIELLRRFQNDVGEVSMIPSPPPSFSTVNKDGYESYLLDYDYNTINFALEAFPSSHQKKIFGENVNEE